MEAGKRAVLVLVVESDPNVLKLVATILRHQSDARVVGATDGEQGLELVRELKPDLVLLAIRLEKLSGFEVARQLKADPLTRSIPLVALTTEARRAALAAGFDDHIGKPFDVSTLVRTVNAHVRVEPVDDGRSTSPWPRVDLQSKR